MITCPNCCSGNCENFTTDEEKALGVGTGIAVTASIVGGILTGGVGWVVFGPIASFIAAAKIGEKLDDASLMTRYRCRSCRHRF